MHLYITHEICLKDNNVLNLGCADSSITDDHSLNTTMKLPIGNYLFFTYELVITSLLCSSALMS